MAALLLVMLIALPFTAPFSTCNVAMLTGDVHTALQLARPLSIATAIESRTETTGSVLEEESFTDVTVAAPEADLFIVATLTLLPPPMPAISVARTPLVALRL